MSDTGETGTGESPPKKKRRVWPWILAVVVLVVAVVGFFVADAAVKSYASNLVKQRIIQVLQLDPATPISVDLGGGSILLQALSGKVSTVHVTAPKVSFGALTGSAVVHATDVPLDRIHPWPKNPDKPTPKHVREICRSVKRFGWGEPILVLDTEPLRVDLRAALDAARPRGRIDDDGGGRRVRRDEHEYQKRQVYHRFQRTEYPPPRLFRYRLMRKRIRNYHYRAHREAQQPDERARREKIRMAVHDDRK